MRLMEGGEEKLSQIVKVPVTRYLMRNLHVN